MVPIEQIICVWLMKLWERPTVENTFKTNSVYWALRVNCPPVRLNQYLQVKCSFSLICIFKQSVHLYHYIQISCLCDSAWSCHHTFTTSWHTTFTPSVPELGATERCSPLHVVRNNHTATLGVMTVNCWWVFIKHRGLQYCQNYLIERFKGLLHPKYENITNTGVHPSSQIWFYLLRFWEICLKIPAAINTTEVTGFMFVVLPALKQESTTVLCKLTWSQWQC